VSQAYGWKSVFMGTICAATVSAVLTLFIPEQHKVRAREDSTSMLQVVRRPGLQRILTVAVMVGWTFGALFTFYQPWALIHGYDHVSGFLIAFALCAMVVRIGFGGLADRVGRLRVAQAALLLYIVTPLSLIWLNVFGLILTGALLGLAHGIFFPALNAVAIEHAQDSERGKAMAAYHGAFNVGFSVGSYLMGYLAMATSYPTIFVLAAVTCSAAFTLLATTPRRGGGH
jgi:predicted MFS family arabinose efflux permease